MSNPLLSYNVQSVELHATVLKRNPNRQYSPKEIDYTNELLQKYLNSSDNKYKKELRRFIKINFDAEIEELGCIADHEGKPNHSNLKLAKWFGRLKG